MAINKTATKVANKIVKYARDVNYPNYEGLRCPDCRFFPVQPVTGNCGHTRCTNCIRRNGICYCGCLPPAQLQINVFVQNLLNKMLGQESQVNYLNRPSTSYETDMLLPRSNHLSHHKTRSGKPYSYPSYRYLPRRLFTNAEHQCAYAMGLLSTGQRELAVPHLAHVAASDLPFARRALDLITQYIEQLLKSNNGDHLTRELYRAVRLTSATSWLDIKDMECVVCYETLEQPVTTTCGHTFCRKCILRALQYTKFCPVCRSQLNRLDLLLSSDTYFVNSALLAVSPRPSVFLGPGGVQLPLIICTVTFPTVPCPFIILGKANQKMIQHMLHYGQTRLGMIPLYDDRTIPMYGTLLEIRDCVVLQEGQLMLTTVGISRFQILKISQDTVYTARVVELKDVVPAFEEVIDMKLEQLAEEITEHALNWISMLSTSVLATIEESFGTMPMRSDEPLWWRNPDCPKWLWWIVAVMPLKQKIQVMLLATNSLHKRMKAVLRLIEVVDDADSTFTFE